MNGRTIADDMARQHEESMERAALRDTFAAAALTGILANEGEGASLSGTCQWAYRIADAMLRERVRNGAPEGCEAVQPGPDPDSRTWETPRSSVPDAWATAYAVTRACEIANHDAAPAARATTKPGGLNSGSASGTSGDSSPVTTPSSGTGDTPSEAEINALEFVVVMGRVAHGWDKDILRQWLIRLRPEFDRSEPIADAAKTNPTQPRNGTPQEGSVQPERSVPDSRSENEPVAWAVRYRHADTGVVELCSTLEECRSRWSNRATDYWKYEPLFRSPPAAWQLVHDNERLRDEVARLRLTDKERASLECMAIRFQNEQWSNWEKVARGLLERRA